MPWTAQSVWPNSICVSVVDDIAGDDATAGACEEATAGNDADSHCMVIVVGPWGHGASSVAGIHMVYSCW